MDERVSDADLLETYRTCGTVTATASALGYCYDRVTKRLRRLGVEPGTPGRPPEIGDADLLEIYRQCGTVKGTARTVGLSSAWAGRRLRALGIPPGKPGLPKGTVRDPRTYRRAARFSCLEEAIV